MKKRAKTMAWGSQQRMVKPDKAGTWLSRLSLMLVLSALAGVPALAQTVNEYQMKAAYLYNLAKFVEWPAESFKTAGDPITICVLGPSPIIQTLYEAENGEPR